MFPQTPSPRSAACTVAPTARARPHRWRVLTRGHRSDWSAPCKTGRPPSLHSRGCRVDVLAHPLAVRLGALAPRLGLACFHCAFWGRLLQLRLLPLLSNLRGGRATAGLEPLWPGKFPGSPARLVAERPSPAHQPPRRGPQTPWWSRCGSPPGGRGRHVSGAGRGQRAPPDTPASRRA